LRFISLLNGDLAILRVRSGETAHAAEHRLRPRRTKRQWIAKMQPIPTVPYDMITVQALARFILRLALLSLFALLSPDFARALASLLSLSALYCGAAAFVRGEALLPPVLTHWDEAAAYAAMALLVAPPIPP
jgi:hypothetical protein